VLEEMSHSDRAMKAISRLHQVNFGGASLALDIGKKISKIANLSVVIGTSEAGYIPISGVKGRSGRVTKGIL
jgi:hypothetical protein